MNAGEVRLTEAEREALVVALEHDLRNADKRGGEDHLAETVGRILAARLAAVPDPSKAGVVAKVRALADRWDREAAACRATGHDQVANRWQQRAGDLRAVLDECGER